jgi:hypothetical protein
MSLTGGSLSVASLKAVADHGHLPVATRMA